MSWVRLTEQINKQMKKNKLFDVPLEQVEGIDEFVGFVLDVIGCARFFRVLQLAPDDVVVVIKVIALFNGFAADVIPLVVSEAEG